LLSIISQKKGDGRERMANKAEERETKNRKTKIDKRRKRFDSDEQQAERQKETWIRLR
jgi:hypothetical protein